MSALALPAAPRRWPAALAWILGLGGLAALLALQIESVQAARGVHGGFGFLFQASGFRISESLLDVLPGDPYWMSLAAGLVNTLTVALAALPGHAAGRGAGPGAPVARSGGVAAGGRHHRAAAQHPGAVAALCLVRPAAAPARRAPGLGAAAVGAAVQSRTGAAGAARLAAASGEPDCRHVDRGLGDSTPAARDGWTRASRTRSAHPRRALAGAGRPAARLDLPARAHRRTASPARTGPARRLATQHRIRHAGHRPVGVPCRLYRRHRARLGARGAGGAGRAGQALALSRLDILRLVVAPNAARVALPPPTSAWR